MTTRIADEKTFVLSDEIIEHINRFFPPPNNHDEKTDQACATLQALINVIGITLCKMDCPDCWEIVINAVESSFTRMLKDVSGIRAESERDQGAKVFLLNPSNVHDAHSNSNTSDL